MYTYLNQRYGLKQLIIEWAGAIIGGIKKYSREDADICLFGKVLRNEIDEDFRFVQLALKETVHTLLKQLVRERHSLKSEVEITRMYDDVVSDRTHIEEWQWSKIIERMYNQQDIDVLEVKIKENAQIRMKQDIESKLNKTPNMPVSPTLSSGKNSTSRSRLTREEQM